MKKHIAIVEDEPALRENYAAALARHGYQVKTYGNRKSAMQAFNTHLPDLAIIDISLEDEAEGGFDLCRDLRALSAELPIIFLTARDSELDAVSGLRLGADDFLTKDVSLPHLAARVAALFRRIDALRRPGECRGDLAARGACRIDGEKMQTTWNGAPVTLSLTEFWIVHRARAQSRACQESAAVDGRRQCGTGRQHHHLARQAGAAQIPAGRRRFRRHPNGVRNGLSLGRVSIRFQLLIVALTTLVLPWAGCQYARELETALRASQENALEASADTIAQALSAQPARVFRERGQRPVRGKSGGSRMSIRCGTSRCWMAIARTGICPRTRSRCRAPPGIRRRLLVGVHRPLSVSVPRGRRSDISSPSRPTSIPNMTGSIGSISRCRGPTARWNPISLRPARPASSRRNTVIKGDDGVDRAASEPRIQAFWLQTARGYHLEARLPLSLVGSRLWLEARDGSGGVSGFMGADSMRGGRLFMATPGLNELLDTFIRPGTRATVVDANALKLGAAGALGSSVTGEAAGPAARGTGTS